MRFLRTAPTGRLLATILGTIAVIAGGTAIAVAATSGGPVPKRQSLAKSLHAALTAPAVTGITANIQFTNNLISSADFTGDTTDPILQGAQGRLWLSPGHGLRLELQGTSNGDAEVVVDNGSFWISDPQSQTIYQGTLPADSSGKKADKSQAVPTVAQLQSDLSKMMAKVDVGGAQTSNPTDVAGQPAYSVRISPQHSGGLLGAAKLAWDAVTGTPLDVGVYARGNPTPVLELAATKISFGPVAQSDIDIPQPAGYKVVKVTSSTPSPAGHAAKKKDVTGVSAVSAQLPFTLAAPATLVDLPRQQVQLLDWGGKPAALVTYGQNLGGMAVVEQKADAGGTSSTSSSSGDSKLSLPTVAIKGATGTELSTALGTVLRWTSGGVSYTVLGSVPAAAAEQAARALTP